MRLSNHVFPGSGNENGKGVPRNAGRLRRFRAAMWARVGVTPRHEGGPSHPSSCLGKRYNVASFAVTRPVTSM